VYSHHCGSRSIEKGQWTTSIDAELFFYKIAVSDRHIHFIFSAYCNEVGELLKNPHSIESKTCPTPADET